MPILVILFYEVIMIESFLFLIVSVAAGIGMAIALVEKGKEWPIRRYRILLQLFIHDYIHWRAAQVLFCTVCSSFWLTLICDVILCIIGLCIGVPYFLWPLSGFISVSITWITIEFLNAIDKEPNINVFVDNETEE
jgi:hypothetical protein